MSVAAVVNPASGTHLKHGTGSGSPPTFTYADVAQIVSIDDGPGAEVDTRETTHLLTPNNAKTFAPGLYDGGEVGGQVELDPKCDSHALLLGLLTTQSLTGEPWQVLFADVTNGPSTATFFGILTKFKTTGIKAGENLLADFTIKVSGTVTWA